MKKILLTGASGFLGQYLLDELLKKDVEIYAFSRVPRESTSPRIKWLVADLSDESTFNDGRLIRTLDDIDIILHAAALYEMGASHEELYRHNVLGTANIIQFARHLKKRPHFAHISTIAIAGNASINFDEATFDVGQSFPDPYGATKFASENIVRNADDIESRSVYRLGIVVGSSLDGTIARIDGPYYLQKIIRRFRTLGQQLGRLRFVPFPYNERTRLYLIPVDIAARLIADLVLKVEQRQGVSTFHVIGGGRGVSARRTLQTMFAYYKIPLNPVSVPKAAMPSFIFRLLGTPYESVEYINAKWTFSSTRLEKEFPGFRYPSFTHISDKLMDFAEQHYFTKDR